MSENIEEDDFISNINRDIENLKIKEKMKKEREKVKQPSPFCDDNQPLKINPFNGEKIQTIYKDEKLPNNLFQTKEKKCCMKVIGRCNQ